MADVSKMQEVNEITLEERFEAIEKILESMEANDTTLDESFALYKSGLEQIRMANQALDRIEKAMIVLSTEGAEADNGI